ncbi:Alpha/Beta hydrolase protein [Limtongia smithiae]|uniref:Alpha/Beta hydrolase protein n=1 Tax=Limtongia smithiae TaxID=1125753 RepID=UPI0034CD70F6
MVLAEPVCDCAVDDEYQCSSRCIKSELRGDTLYYKAAIMLYEHAAKELFPGWNIWVTGHSLGGAIASFVAQTKHIPGVAFESPGDKLASARLGLAKHHILGDSLLYHVGNTADPVFMGKCTGKTSVCGFGGYALETACHAGHECVYDVVKDNDTTMSILYHSIQTVMDEVIMKYEEVPKCVRKHGCTDCVQWEFV